MVATRRQEQVENALLAPDVRRGGRDRKPVQPFTVTEPTPTTTTLNNRFSSTGGKNNGTLKGKKVPPSLGWMQTRKEQEKKIQNEKRRKTIPTTLIDPYTGDTVWIATATLQDIATANKKHKPPWLLSARYLVMVPSVQQRQIVYDRAANAIADLEQRILPTYGGRLQWKCIVTIKETTIAASSKSSNRSNESNSRKKSNDSSTSSNKKSPYFIWNKRGQLELAAFPYMIEKIPNPPHFPGYYKNGKTNSSNRTKSNNKATSATSRSSTKNNKQKQQSKCEEEMSHVHMKSQQGLPAPTASASIDYIANEVDRDKVIVETYNVKNYSNERTVAVPFNNVSTAIDHTNTDCIVRSAVKVHDDFDIEVERNEEIVEEEEEEADDDDDDDEDEEELLSDEILQLRELQERAITALAELAYDDRWRVTIPTVHYKWISPLQQTFYTRKSAWDHAITLCKNDLLLDKVLYGYGAHGKTIAPKLPTQTNVFNAGKLRFVRDGLWIIGQEEKWIHERLHQQFDNGEGTNHTDEKIGTFLQQPNVATQVNIAVTVLPQQRPLTGLSLFIKKTRTQHRQKRLKEMLEDQKEFSTTTGSPTIHVISPPLSTASASMKSDTDSSSSSSSSLSTCIVDPVTTLQTPGVMQTPRKGHERPLDVVSKCTLVEATKELRIIWKDMTEGEKMKWNNEATEQNELDMNAVAVPLSATGQSVVITKQSNTITKTKTSHPCRSKKWSLNEQQIKLCYDAGMEHYDQIMRTVTARDLFRELEDGFDLLRERGKGRWDMNIPDFDTSEYSFLNDTKKSPWMPVVKEILGKDVVLIHKGIFLSMPGSNKQVYHQDGPHLTTQYQKPCHAINVFVPLVDLALDNGPTEFCLGSHILGYDDLNEDYVTIPTVSAGTPIIFDYRLGHRGLGNSSNSCRPIVYCTYAASADGKEFRDSVNFSRKRYHRIGDLVEKGLTRTERAEKRQRT